MSSIYPKGRDGYYYYQAYVYNPDTGKMNKRIFHSLGTKDQAEAEKMQSELDSQHEHQKTQPQKGKSLSSLFLNWKTLPIVLAIVIVIIFYIDIFQSDLVKPINREVIVKEPVLIDGKLQERLILPFSLSYDHRVIDGADAARFTTQFGRQLSKYDKLT